MKNKLLSYLNKEHECLKDILMQTNEIKKSIDKEDIDYANRLLTGREKNIKKANKYSDAVMNIFKRAKGGELVDDKRVDSLKREVTAILEKIKELDNWIMAVLTKEHAESKANIKNTKAIRRFSKGYSKEGGAPAPKHFDKKT